MYGYTLKLPRRDPTTYVFMKNFVLSFIMNPYLIDTVKFQYQDHLWDCPKVVLKTTFAQSQRWSLIRGTLGVENEEMNNLNFANKVFNR